MDRLSNSSLSSCCCSRLVATRQALMIEKCIRVRTHSHGRVESLHTAASRSYAYCRRNFVTLTNSYGYRPRRSLTFAGSCQSRLQGDIASLSRLARRPRVSPACRLLSRSQPRGIMQTNSLTVCRSCCSWRYALDRMVPDTHTKHGHGGLHLLWQLDPQRAVVWSNGKGIRPNFYPYGRELRRWMLRQNWTIPAFPAGKAPFTNPYTEDAAVLVSLYMQVTNSGALWADEIDPMPWISAELQRVRLYSEFVLYTVRVCEALIKQLLFCTDLIPKSYRRVELTRFRGHLRMLRGVHDGETQ
jgi:hypothetical protein